MEYKLCVFMTVLLFQAIGAKEFKCPSESNCTCEGGLALEINCNIDGKKIQISLLPDTYFNIVCEDSTTLNYDKLPKLANDDGRFKSVFFKNCPLPPTSFQEVLDTLGISETLALMFQNSKRVSGLFDRKHFTGLRNLTTLLISVKDIKNMPDDLFNDVQMLQWLSIRSNSLNLTQELFTPLDKLQTLEISEIHKFQKLSTGSNISSHLFSHLSSLKKLSIWQSNDWFSTDLFTGADVLEELDLSSNGLDELPEGIFKPLKKLKKLTLFANKFTSLPKNLFQWHTYLESVSILNNDVELHTLPEKLLGNLPNLEHVHLQKCGLKDVPHDLFWNSPSILTISLAYNHIRKLPDAIFNDQINLSELDLSWNQLQMLGPKLFSSLVRLNRLNLAHNELTKISGYTFSPLYSLYSLNLDHNKLQVIDSLLLVNNKLPMRISMAYNKLDFEDESLGNNTWYARKTSPFASLCKLQLLNLSHNEFKHTFKDWWVNGHYVLDISYNHLESLRDNVFPSETYYFRGSMKELWLSHNNFECSCTNTDFLNYMVNGAKTKVCDFQGFDDCPFWTKGSCDLRTNIMFGMIGLTVLCALCPFVIVKTKPYLKNMRRFKGFVPKLKYLYNKIKSSLTVIKKQNQKKMKQSGIMVKYSKNDEEFVFKQILPGLKQNLGLRQGIKQMSTSTYERIFLATTKSKKQLNISLIILTPNYITSVYNHVDMKTILGEMMKSKDTFYVFVDTGSEDTTHAFLKEERDPATTIIWDDPYFWTKIKYIVKNKRQNSINVTPIILTSIVCSNPPDVTHIHIKDTETSASLNQF